MEQTEVTVKSGTRFASIFSVVLFASGAATRAAAAKGDAAARRHAVFVQTNAPAGNAIVVYLDANPGTGKYESAFLPVITRAGRIQPER